MVRIKNGEGDMRQGLKQGRKMKNMTQKETALYLGIAPVNYQNIEAGRNGTSEDNWLKLFDLFDRIIPMDELMKNETADDEAVKR